MTRVTIVGAGPGSADLITLRGARALASASVVLHDALVDPALRDMAPQAEWVDVGKRGFCDSTAQTRINALLVQHARAGGRRAQAKGHRGHHGRHAANQIHGRFPYPTNMPIMWSMKGLSG